MVVGQFGVEREGGIAIAIGLVLNKIKAVRNCYRALNFL